MGRPARCVDTENLPCAKPLASVVKCRTESLLGPWFTAAPARPLPSYRTCIPRALLPHKYDYHRPATAREIGLDDGAGAAGQAGSGPASGATHGSLTRGTGGLRRLMSWLLSLSWMRTGPAGPGAGTPAGGGGGGGGVVGSRLARARGGGGGGAVGRGGRASDDGDVETGHGSKECVICMSPVPLFPLNARMLTPCGHFFHQHCLTRWMEVKLDCPTCRRQLPPP